MNTYAEIFPPGEFLKDELEARNWSQTEFAEIIGRPVRLVNEIIAGKRGVTPETALQLAASLGTSAELWMNLESQYQLSKVRQSESVIQRKAKLYSIYPVRDMTKRGWISASDDIDIMEHQFKQYFELPSLDALPTLAHAAKKTSYESVTSLQWSWLFRVKHLAESVVMPKYNKSLLLESLPKIHSLMSAPEEIRHIPRVLNEAGVRFVLVEALPGSSIDGACLWLKSGQPVIAMSSRLDRIDNFWFVLRHELEHLIQEHGKDAGMKLDEDICESINSNENAEEVMANDAAAEFGVGEAELSSYVARVNPYVFSRAKVFGFAARLGIHPGIVVGRLQKRFAESTNNESYKYLRDTLVKVRQILTASAPSDGWGQIYHLK